MKGGICWNSPGVSKAFITGIFNPQLKRTYFKNSFVIKHWNENESSVSWLKTYFSGTKVCKRKVLVESNPGSCAGRQSSTVWSAAFEGLPFWPHHVHRPRDPQRAGLCTARLHFRAPLPTSDHFLVPLACDFPFISSQFLLLKFSYLSCTHHLLKPGLTVICSSFNKL